MDRLSLYILRQFATQALTIFLAGGVLIWLMQLLRLFDIVAAQGQNILTLMGQSALTTPTYARSILYVCLAIGLARGLRALQNSRELHTIHAGQRFDALLKAIVIFTLAGMIAVTAIAHWIEPRGRTLSSEWSERIAADIVGRALVPGQFSEIVPGIVATARGRAPDGTLQGFFLDDDTNETRRTYFAQTAEVFQDEAGYQLILDEGAIQYEGANRGGLSQIAFSQYHVSLDSLVQANRDQGGIDQTDSLTLLAGLREGTVANVGRARALLHARAADTLRALTFAVLVMAFMALPHGQRGGRRLPAELSILVLAFAEQALSAFIGGGAYHYLAPSALLAFALIVFWRRLARATLAPRLGPGLGSRRRA